MGVCVLQVTLAYESILLYMCEGKVLMDRKVPRLKGGGGGGGDNPHESPLTINQGKFKEKWKALP